MPISEALKGAAPVRVVGQRQIPARPFEQTDIDLMSDQDIDDLRAEVRAEREARAADGAIDDALVEAARLRVDELKPSIRAFAHFLFAAIDPRLRERMAEGRHACILVRLPDARWERVVRRAMIGAVDLVEIDRRVRLGSAARAVGATSPRYGRKADRVALDEVVTSVGLAHTIVTVKPGDVVSGAVHALVDVEIAWDPAEWLDEIVAAIRVTFPTFAWPTHVDVRRLHSRYVDVATFRSQHAVAVCEFLERFVDHATEEDEAEAARAKAETEARKRKAAPPVEVLRPDGPKVEDLAGYGDAARWAADLVQDVADYAAKQVGWADVDGACLVAGPPGTGKTLYARAVAASARLPFIATSYAEWQGFKEGHLGNLIACMREVFAAASEVAPCVLFIDEIDAIAARGSGGQGLVRHDDWWSAVNAALLELLDGTPRREGVVVIAACNHPDKLDPALARSGRLDRRFHVGLPDEAALRAIFAHHLPGCAPDAFEPAAVALAGSISGADVARFAREARRAARRERRDLAVEDLIAVALPPDTRSEDLRRLAAVHEAGHAVACIVAGQVPSSMSVVRIGDRHGGVWMPADLGLRTARGPRGARRRDARRQGGRGGRARRRVRGLGWRRRVGPRRLDRNGLGDRLSVGQAPSSAVEERLQVLYRRGVETVTRHRADVEALADLVGERLVLSKAALERFAHERRIGR